MVVRFIVKSYIGQCQVATVVYVVTYIFILVIVMGIVIMVVCIVVIVIGSDVDCHG